jgi:hypothetical protein
VYKINAKRKASSKSSLVVCCLFKSHSFTPVTCAVLNATIKSVNEGWIISSCDCNRSFTWHIYTPTGKVNGHLVNGTISNDMLEGPLKGKTLEDLASLMRSGDSYGTNIS